MRMALAQPSSDRALQSVRAEQGSKGWEVTLTFSVPLRYVRHTPRGTASLAVIELQATGVGRTEGARPLGREALRPFEDGQGPPVLEVSTDPRPSGARVVEIRFREEVSFEVSQGKDLHVLRVLFPRAAESPDDGRAAALLENARLALSESDPERAAQLTTKVLELDAPGAHPEAQEMLGLARERNGQRSHARVEYERFLEKFPDDERAPRVRQRLNAIATASEAPPERGRFGPTRSTGPRFDVHGSVSSYYSRAELYFDDGIGSQLVDSSWISDLYLNGRMRTDAYEFEASASGRSRIDLSDDDFGNDSRLSSLLLEGEQRGQGWWGNLGRQRGNGGVIGRFDGARVGYRFNDSLDGQVLVGFPLESYSSDGLNTDRVQVGAAGQALEVFDLVDVALYTNYQNEDDLNYRAAIGGEVRHLRRGRSIVASIDYDAYFNAVNIAMLLADIEVSDELSVNTLLEYRKSPILTMGNALIGQQAGSVSDLHDTFSASQMKDLAKDRTADATNFTLGARYEVNDRLDLSGNWTASKLSGTSSSGGVAGTSSTGYQFTYYAQAASRALLMDRGVSTVGIRVFDGDRYDAYMLQLNGRYPVAPMLRLNPIIRLEYQDSDENRVRFIPRLRLDYTWRDIVFDLDFAYSVTQASGPRPNDHGYSLLVGLRFDF
jgi:tetratricopeptide (TPR) repeat protein